MHLDSILNETFLNLFIENPDIKDKFFAFKDYTVEDLRKPESDNGCKSLFGTQTFQALCATLDT
jgi:hypothetical protein